MKLSADEFVELTRQALAHIPEPFAAYLEDVLIDVEAVPDPEACKEGGVDDPRDLLGLYLGTPLTQRSAEDPAQLPDRIVLYQRNIERVCRSRGEIINEIRKTVFHEVGHHFGLDEDDLEQLGYE